MKLTKRLILKQLLLCAAMYVVVLFASVFICSSVYNAINNASRASVEKKAPATVASTNQKVSQEN